MGVMLMVKAICWVGSGPEVLHGGELYFLLELHHIFAEKAVGIHQVFDGLAGMDDRGMVATAKMLADGLEGVFGEGFSQVHSNLPCLHDLSFAGFLQ